MEPTTVPFIVADPRPETEPDAMGIFGRFEAGSALALHSVPIDALKNNLETLSHSILSVLKDIRKVGEYRLREVKLQVEVSASGGVCLIGTAQLGGKGAISLTFGE